MRRWIERFLLSSGLILLGIWGGEKLTSFVWQAWQNRNFNHEMKGQQSQPTPLAVPRQAAKPKRGDVLGRLSIPRLDLSSMVREGDDEGTLSLALGHVPGTALPGQRGNVAVAGHRDTLFRALKDIRKNDVIRFETLSGSHDYQVDNIRIVKPDDVAVLRSGPTSELTLVTCYPFYYVGAAPKRFIVSAREMTAGQSQPQIRSVREEIPSQPPLPPVTHAVPRRSVEEPRDAGPGFEMRGISFEIPSGHGREVAPGISVGISAARNGHADGWMWVMPDRRSVLFTNQAAGKPLVFYQDGERRELVLSGVSGDSVRGSVLLSHE